MFSFLKTAVSVGSATFSLAKVLMVAVPLLTAALIGTWFLAKSVGRELGVSEERGRQAAAALALSELHSLWLVEAANENNAAEQDNTKAVVDNSAVGTELDREIEKLSDSGVCLPAPVMRGIARLR